MSEAELILDPGLGVRMKFCAPGLGHFWPRELVHTYKNTTDTEASILCVDKPKFIREDEVESELPLGERTLAQPTRYFGEGESGVSRYLIFGATSGIGAAIADDMLQRGEEVIAVGRNPGGA